MALYRGQTTTTQKIQAISTLRITTKAEAIAFLRAISNIELQIADVLQRSNMQDLAARNQTPAVEPKVEEVVPEVKVEQPELPLTFDDETEHSDSQKAERVSRLKKLFKKDGEGE